MNPANDGLPAQTSDSKVTALPDEAATDRVAAALAAALAPGWRIHLSGPLGAGKTRFARGLLHALGHEGRVRSPTFALLEPYALSRFPVYHFDFYRFSGNNDWRDAGFDEWLGDPNAVTLIEWPEMAGDQLPVADLHLEFEFDATGSRSLHLRAHSPRATRWLDTIAPHPPLTPPASPTPSVAHARASTTDPTPPIDPSASPHRDENC